jgi:hypothetical protein
VSLQAVVGDTADLCTAFPCLTCGQVAGLLSAADQDTEPQFTATSHQGLQHLLCQVTRQRNGTYRVAAIEEELHD